MPSRCSAAVATMEPPARLIGGAPPAGRSADGDGVEEAQRRVEDGPDRLVEEAALGEDGLERLQEGEVTGGRHGFDVLRSLLGPES